MKRMTGGLFVLLFLIGTLGTLSIGMSVGAAGGSSVATACMKGGYDRYVDEGGDRFPDEQTCVGWVADNPGQPLLIDMAKLCSQGAYILYADDDGNQFTDEEGCLGWVADHPGQPPVAMDDTTPDDPNA